MSYDLNAQVAQLDLQNGPPQDTDTGMASAAGRPTTDTPAVNALRSLLRQTLRITILDGRIFLGTFAGTDKLLNVLLVSTDEFVLPQASRAYANPDGRFVGLVQIPWRLVVKIEAHRPHRERSGSSGEYGPETGERYARDESLYS